jgi:hypothetical protein
VTTNLDLVSIDVPAKQAALVALAPDGADKHGVGRLGPDLQTVTISHALHPLSTLPTLYSSKRSFQAVLSHATYDSGIANKEI